MRQRAPYSVEKQEAAYRIADIIEMINYCPMDRETEIYYRAEVSRLATRYGLRNELKGAGYDLSL